MPWLTLSEMIVFGIHFVVNLAYFIMDLCFMDAS